VRRLQRHPAGPRAGHDRGGSLVDDEHPAPRDDGGLDAFISYSHRDTEFVLGLKSALERGGHVVWVDADDIPVGAPWREELGSGVEAADAFVFVITPESLASPECEKELARALELGKRLVPVLLRPADGVPPGLAAVQYVHADGRDPAGVAALVAEAIDTDHDWVRQHTLWLTRALRWEAHDHQRAYLLRGAELRAAEDWLARQGERLEPPPTPLQTEFIVAGRRSETRRLRIFLAAALAAVLVSAALAAFALVQRSEAIAQRDRAQSRQLAASSVSQLGIDPELSLLLGLEGVDKDRTPEAEQALRRALEESHVTRTLRRHEGSVNEVAYNPDGTVLATASSDGTVRLTSPKDGRALGVIEPGEGPVRGVIFSPNGTRLLTREDGETVQVWSLEGDRLATLDGNRGAFSPDGSRIVTGGADGTARVYETDTGVEIAQLDDPQPVRSVEFASEGGTVMVAASELVQSAHGTVRIWDVRSGEDRAVGAYAEPVLSADLNADGTRLATVGVFATTIWDVASGEMLAEVGAGFLAVFSPDGDRLLTAANDGTARVWTADGEEVAVLRDSHGGLVLDAGWSDDGSLVLTAGTDRTARVWSPDTGEVLAYLRGHTDTVSSAAFSLDGRTVATAGGDAEARLWDIGRPVVMAGHGDFEPPLQDVNAQVTSVDFSPDGERLLTGAQDATARIWDAGTGEEILDPPGCEAAPEGFSCLSAAVSLGGQFFITDVEFGPDGATALIASAESTAWIRDAASGAGLAQLTGHTGRVDGAAFSPDGTRAVTASADSTARIWDAATGDELLLLQHDAPVTDAVFDPNGERVLTSAGNGTLRLWDVGDGSLARTFEGAGAVGGIAFSPDGSLVAAPADEAAKVFDVETGEQVALLQGHVGLVSSASFSPDGTFLVTAGFDRTAQVWDLDTGAAVLVLRGHDGPVTRAVFSPDGRRIATSSQDATARVWECEVCVPDDELVELAQASVTRELTPAERDLYLGS
jgi:WD40 repeat protein